MRPGIVVFKEVIGNNVIERNEDAKDGKGVHDKAIAGNQ